MKYNLVGGLEREFYFPIQLGMSSSQLTNSYFSEGVGQPPTSIQKVCKSRPIWRFGCQRVPFLLTEMTAGPKRDPSDSYLDGPCEVAEAIDLPWKMAHL